MSAPGQAPIGWVPMDLKDAAELIVRRISQEQIEPLREEVNNLRVEVAKVHQAVHGNGSGIPLAVQIEKVREEALKQAAILHKRITDLHQAPAVSEDHEEIKKSSTMRERLIGGFELLKGIGTACLVLAGLVATFKTVLSLFLKR